MIKAPKETGKTFKSNSELKANFFYEKSKMISLSDDSGLEILALNKKPGMYSARWAKKSGSFRKAMLKILNKIKDKKNKKARFICSLSIKLSKNKIITTEGIIKAIFLTKLWFKRIRMILYLFQTNIRSFWTNENI